MKYYRNSFLSLAALLVTLSLAAVWTFGSCCEEREHLQRKRQLLGALTQKCTKAEAELEKERISMQPVHGFLKAWVPFIKPVPQDQELAVSMRTALESLAQRKLSLITDQCTTPEPVKFSFSGRSLLVQKLSLRASGENLGALLAWLGEAESMYPLARVEAWEISPAGISNSALKITLTQPLALGGSGTEKP